MIRLKGIGGCCYCFSTITETLGLGRTPGHHLTSSPSGGPIVFLVRFLFHSWGNSCSWCYRFEWFESCLKPSQSTELWLGRHRPSPSMGQKLLVFTGVGEAPLYHMTHQFARVVACSGVKSQVLGGDTCPRSLPKSFHTPCQPRNGRLRVHFGIASPKNLVLHRDGTRFHKPHYVPTVLISSINSSCKHEQGPLEPAQSSTSIQRGEREMYSVILLWR